MSTSSTSTDNHHKHAPTSMQSQKPPQPHKPKTADTAPIHWQLWVMFGGLLLLVVASSWALLARDWHRPLTDLLVPSMQLNMDSMVTQLTLVATSVVALLAGGLLGAVSILLQQLVKNPLASDTTLGVGVGAQLAILVVSLFLPSLAIHGGMVVAFIGALASMGLVFALAAASRFNALILVLAGLVVNILLAALANVLVLFFAQQSNGMMSWAAGFLTQNSWHTSMLLALATVVLVVACLPLLKPLGMMSLDDWQAKRLGVPVQGIRAIVVLLVAVVKNEEKILLIML